MKNPFNKQSATTDTPDTEANTSTGKSGKRFLNRTKTKKVKLTKNQTDVDQDSINQDSVNQNSGGTQKPTLKTHGFDYSDSDYSDSEDNQTSNNFNPYVYNETDDTDAPLTAVQGNNSNWYSLSGRIGRVKLLAYGALWGIFLTLFILIFILISGSMFALILAGTSATKLMGLMGLPFIVMSILLLPILVYSMILLPRRRLHDINKSGWWLLLYLVPIVSLLLMYWLYFKAGDEGINDYGLPPRANTTAEKVLAVLGGLFVALSIILPFIGPMYADPYEDIYTDDAFSENSEITFPDSDSESIFDDQDDFISTDGVEFDTENNPDIQIQGSNDAELENQTTNQVVLNSNEQLDPEVQAEIDAALGRSSNAQNGSNESDNISSSDTTYDTSYEEFIRASETPILVDTDSDDDQSISENN